MVKVIIESATICSMCMLYFALREPSIQDTKGMIKHLKQDHGWVEEIER